MLGVLPIFTLEEDGISFESLVQSFTSDENTIESVAEALSLLNRRIVCFDPKVLDAFVFPKFEAAITKKIYVRKHDAKFKFQKKSSLHVFKHFLLVCHLQ
jgi:hypothetical protein